MIPTPITELTLEQKLSQRNFNDMIDKIDDVEELRKAAKFLYEMNAISKANVVNLVRHFES